MNNYSEQLGHIESTENDVRHLLELEARTPVTLREDNSVRVKATDNCGMTCIFCHNEGTPVTNDQQVQRGRVSIFEQSNGVSFLATDFGTDNFISALNQLNQTLGTDEVHWTGGEPSLSRNIVELTKQANEQGFKVKMTSNGETGSMKMEELAQAGLASINFSIFGTTPAELASVQAPRFRNEKFAGKKLIALDEAIHAATNTDIHVKANVVIPDYSHRDRVHRILDKYGDTLELRLLPSLDEGLSSLHAIYKILSDLGAVPIARTITVGSSNNKTDFQLPDGRIIGYKQIARLTLPVTCSDCRFNSDVDCAEGYYGIRMYQDEYGEMRIGVCIQRMDLTSSLNEFIQGSIPQEIKDLKATHRQELESHYEGLLT